MAFSMVREIWVERDVDAVLVVERGDQVAVAVDDAGLLGQRLHGELGGQVVHAAGHVARGHPDDPGEGDRETGHESAHHGGDGGHDAEMGQDAGGRKSLVRGHGHASHVTRAVPTRPIHGIRGLVTSDYGKRADRACSRVPRIP